MKKKWNKFVTAHSLRVIDGGYYLVPLYKSPENIVKVSQLVAYIINESKKGLEFVAMLDLLIKKYDMSRDIVLKKIFGVMSEDKKVPKDSSKVVKLKSTLYKKDKLFKASIELTGKCNLNCIHCYAVSLKSKATLSTKELKAIVDQLVEQEVIFINLTGGECTSRSDFAEVYEHIRRKGLIPTIITNGTFIKGAVYDVLKKYPPYFIKVSIYGASAKVHDSITRVEGSFDKTMEGIKKIRKAGINIYIGASVFNGREEEISKLKVLSRDLDVPIYFYSSFVRKLDGDKSPLKYKGNKNVLREIKKINLQFKADFIEPLEKNHTEYFSCNAGLEEVHISSDGILKLCKMDRGNGFSIIKHGFQNAHSQLKIFREELFSKKHKVCPILY